MSNSRARPALSIGFVVIPDFTMLALAGFIDTLRLAGDEADRSRQIDCRWTVMTSDGNPVAASNGLRVTADSRLADPSGFDYLAVVGGIMHRQTDLDPLVVAYLAGAARAHIPLIGICTGGFMLARAGLMEGRRCCVSWFHKADLELEFPSLTVVADQLFVIDRDRITCAGGTSVIHLASHLIEQHLGAGRSAKGLRVMLEDRARPASSPQPLPLIPGLENVNDARVRRAMLLIERSLVSPPPLDEVARACGITERQLGRLFNTELGQSPSRFREALRIARAKVLLDQTCLSLTEIAFRCGFSDAAHFSRTMRVRTGFTPTALRNVVTESTVQ